MLVASAVHPAMLAYLDNANSTGSEPNENYARELMELHTLGVDGGYTERDVKQAALLLTGWQLEQGEARYVPARHHVGAVRILGVRYVNGSAAGGQKAARQFLRRLASHPATARFVAHKLAVRFVSDSPPAALVQHLAAAYLRSGTAITPVLGQLFSSREFAASGGAKLRRPFERIIATARALGVRPGADREGLKDLYWMLESSGHKPLGWPLPNGYPDVASSWQSPASALDQFNIATAIVHGWWPTKLDLPGPAKLLATPPRTASGVVDAVARRLLGRAPTATERDAGRRLLASTRLPASFARGSWEQQESIALVATLLLNSPAHLVR
jgi:uncharacterized protein (DUF1800 family)